MTDETYPNAGAVGPWGCKNWYLRPQCFQGRTLFDISFNSKQIRFDNINLDDYVIKIKNLYYSLHCSQSTFNAEKIIRNKYLAIKNFAEKKAYLFSILIFFSHLIYSAALVPAFACKLK